MSIWQSNTMPQVCGLPAACPKTAFKNICHFPKEVTLTDGYLAFQKHHRVCGLLAACPQTAFKNICHFSKESNPYL